MEKLAGSLGDNSSPRKHFFKKGNKRFSKLPKRSSDCASGELIFCFLGMILKVKTIIRTKVSDPNYFEFYFLYLKFLHKLNLCLMHVHCYCCAQGLKTPQRPPETMINASNKESFICKLEPGPLRTR